MYLWTAEFTNAIRNCATDSLRILEPGQFTSLLKCVLRSTSTTHFASPSVIFRLWIDARATGGPQVLQEDPKGLMTTQ